MRMISTAAVIAAAMALCTPAAMAGPCDTGTTKAKSPNEQAANPKSSDTDQSSKNLAGGQQPASPGTVGAMNNVGAGQATGQKDASSDKGKEDPASKNLAGGQQPASPGTVGAMNNAGADQKLGQGKDDC